MPTIDVSDLTLRQIREIQNLLPPVPGGSMAPATGLPEHPYSIGATYIVRTVTYHYTGRLVAVYPGEIVLEDAAWIADTDRWSEALATGKLSEVEPYPGACIVSRGAIVDVARWAHALPRSVK